MNRWLIGLLFAVLTSAAHALPSVADVEAQVQQGHYAQAQSMMRDVVAAKPGSAKAHYIYAEILAHNASFAEAAREAALAKELDPSLKFTDPARFNDFERLLEREQRRAGDSARSGSSLESLGSMAPQRVEDRAQGVPAWVWLAGLAVLAVLAWRMIDRSRAGPAAAASARPSYASTAGMPPYGSTPARRRPQAAAACWGPVWPPPVGWPPACWPRSFSKAGMSRGATTPSSIGAPSRTRHRVPIPMRVPWKSAASISAKAMIGATAARQIPATATPPPTMAGDTRGLRE